MTDLLVEKYQLILEEKKADVWKNEPIIAYLDLDHGGEYAGFKLLRKEKPLPDTAVPAVKPNNMNISGFWVNLKDPEPDYNNHFLRVYITKSGQEFIDVYRKVQGYGGWGNKSTPQDEQRLSDISGVLYKSLGINGMSDPKVPYTMEDILQRQREKELFKKVSADTGIDLDI